MQLKLAGIYSIQLMYKIETGSIAPFIFSATPDFTSLAQQFGVTVSLPNAATAAIAAQAAAASPATAMALQAAQLAAAANQSVHSPANVPAVQQAAAAAQQAAAAAQIAGATTAGSGGKTRSSMSLQLLSGRYVHRSS